MGNGPPFDLPACSTNKHGHHHQCKAYSLSLTNGPITFNQTIGSNIYSIWFDGQEMATLLLHFTVKHSLPRMSQKKCINLSSRFFFLVAKKKKMDAGSEWAKWFHSFINDAASFTFAFATIVAQSILECGGQSSTQPLFKGEEGLTCVKSSRERTEWKNVGCWKHTFLLWKTVARKDRVCVHIPLHRANEDEERVQWTRKATEGNERTKDSLLFDTKFSFFHPLVLATCVCLCVWNWWILGKCT